MNFGDRFVEGLKRVAAAMIATGVGLGLTKLGITVAPDVSAQVADVVVGGAMLGIYGLAHKLFPDKGTQKAVAAEVSKQLDTPPSILSAP